MNTIAIQPYSSPFGDLMVGAISDKLCLCHWQSQKNTTQLYQRLSKHFDASIQQQNGSLITQTIEQLNEYFQQGRTTFDLPLTLAGTQFQQQVWQQLRLIPYGQTISYQQLAQNIANKTAVRAVANANAANPLAIIIPCHRVIGANGKLTGYAGGLATKQALLNLEQG